MGKLLTAGFWTLSIVCVVGAGALATLFVFIPISLDPSEMITAGVEPWQDAAVAVGAFSLLLVAAVVSLRLWHTRRLKPLALLLAVAEIAAVCWSGALVYRDYF